MTPPLLTFRLVDPHSQSDFATETQWDSDPLIRHLISPFPNQTEFETRNVTFSMWQAMHLKAPSTSRHFMISLDGRAVGSASIQIDPKHRITTAPHTAWFGLTIGQASDRGKGYGKLIVTELESRARALGATQAEVGVFEFNLPSLRLFQKMGYVEMARIPDFTWWNGRMWADVRLTKSF